MKIYVPSQNRYYHTPCLLYLTMRNQDVHNIFLMFVLTLMSELFCSLNQQTQFINNLYLTINLLKYSVNGLKIYFTIKKGDYLTDF